MITRRTLGAVAVIALLAAGGCSTFRKHDHGGADSGPTAKANRIPVIALNDQLKVADALKGQDFLIPPPAPQPDWPLPGGTLEQSVENVDAAPAFQVAWRRSIGQASSRRHHITAPPIAEGGRIFVMDGGADGLRP